MTWARRPDWIDCAERRAVEDTDLEPHVYTVKPGCDEAVRSLLRSDKPIPDKLRELMAYRDDEAEPATWHDETRGGHLDDTFTPIEASANGLAKAFGAWPGDESDEEIEALLSERTPEEEALHDALRRFGFTEQARMLQEECGELIAAINHWFRGLDDAFDSMIEEIADVEILIDQMRLVYGAEIDAARARKLARLKERLG